MKLDPAVEQRLLQAVTATSALVDDGMSPNSAIVKVAKDQQLRVSEIPLIVNAYNTGRTGWQRMEGSNPQEKAASFALADTATILDVIYPDRVKTAAEIHHATDVSDVYASPPRHRKQASEARPAVDWRKIGDTVVTAPPPLPTEPRGYRDACDNVAAARTQVENARREKSAAADACGAAFMTLSEYFQRPAALPFVAVKTAATWLHGEPGRRLFELLESVTPGLAKLAAAKQGQTAADLDCRQPPFDLIADVLAKLETQGEKTAAHAAACDQYSATATQQLGAYARPLVRKTESLIPDEPTEKVAISLNDPLKTLGTYSLLNRTFEPIAQRIKGPDTQTRLERTLSLLNDPTHETRLREINAQAMLQNFMANDPIISGYPAHEVANAYSDISQLSPSTADQPLLSQTLLRKVLQQGQLDTHEQDQLLNIDSKLRRSTTGSGAA